MHMLESHLNKNISFAPHARGCDHQKLLLTFVLFFLVSTLTCTCVCGCRLGCPVMCGSCTTTTTTATTTTTIVETVAPSTVAQPKTTHGATTTHPATTTNAGHASNCVQVAEGSLDRQLCECDLWGSATEGTVLAVLILSATFFSFSVGLIFCSSYNSTSGGSI